MVKIESVRVGNRVVKLDTIYKKLYKDATNKKEFAKLFSGYKTNPNKAQRLANIYFG